MRHTKKTIQFNHEHFAKVIVARHRHNDIQDAKVVAYMDRAVAQATDNVNRNFVKRFLEAL